MQLYTINATPVQNHEQMVSNGYSIDASNTVEHINRLHIAEYPETVSRVLRENGLDGFTIHEVLGYWEGVSEVSFEIKIATSEGEGVITNICTRLRDIYNQDAVMLTLPDNSVQFI